MSSRGLPDGAAQAGLEVSGVSRSAGIVNTLPGRPEGPHGGAQTRAGSCTQPTLNAHLPCHETPAVRGIDIGLPELWTRAYKKKFITEFLTTAYEQSRISGSAAAMALASRP